MILSDKDIKNSLNEGKLSIDPLNYDNIGPTSIDLTLSNSFARMKYDDDNPITLNDDLSNEYEHLRQESYIMLPGEFLLASTQEYIELPKNLTAFVEGRSSIGRLGLFIHNAGFIDSGFNGEITLELYNASNRMIKLEKGRRICQIVISETKTASEFGYQGKYNGQFGATVSSINLDKEVS